MPAIIWEDPKSPTVSVGRGATAERIYHCLVTSEPDTGDEAVAYAAATGESPTYTNGLARTSVRCDPEGGPLWEIRVGYSDTDGGKDPIPDDAELPANPTTVSAPPPPPISPALEPVTPPYIGGTGADDGGSEPLGGLGLGTPGAAEAASVDGQPSPNDPIGGEYSFEAGSGTVKVSKSLETIHRLKATGVNATDLKGLIGPKQDGELEGAEIPDGKFEWSTVRRARAISLAYLRSLSRAVGKVNDAAWMGWAAGELIFDSASGQYERGKGWALTFKFRASENETNVVVSPTITVPSKDGWDYLWVGIRQEPNPDGAGAFPPLVPVVKAAYVERVIKRISFPTYLGF